MVDLLQSTQIIFMVEGGDDVAFLQGFFGAKGVPDQNINVTSHYNSTASHHNPSNVTLHPSGGITRLVTEFKNTIRALKRKSRTDTLLTKAIVVLTDESNAQDTQHIQEIQTILRENALPCPERNSLTNDPDSPIQFGLYVLSDLEGHYNDLESIALHTLKQHTESITDFSAKVGVVRTHFNETCEQQGLDITRKRSKRELAVCLASFPNYEGNPRPVLRNHFETYFDINHKAFTPLNRLLDTLNKHYALFPESEEGQIPHV
jgi:hypothetical protein